MNAIEARAISDKNKIKNSRVPAILEKIAEAANKGKHTYNVLETFSDDDAQILRSMGYKVIYYPDPDPGHPCSRPYSEINW
jgi:hypothetical protein